MFSSFFPFPRLFFPSVIVWTLVCIACWYGYAADLGVLLVLALNLLGDALRDALDPKTRR